MAPLIRDFLDRTHSSTDRTHGGNGSATTPPHR